MMNPTIKTPCLALALLAGVLAPGCAAEVGDNEPPQVETAAVQQALNSNELCMENWRPAPAPNGCTIEIGLETVAVVMDQGLSEGKLEINVSATANGDTETWPSDSGATKISDGTSKTIDEQITEVHLARGEQKVMEVCALVTEVDRGGINGQSDNALICEDVTLSCRMPPAYFSGQQPLCKGGLEVDETCSGGFNGAVEASFSAKRADADGDGVINPIDFTPDPCDEESMGDNGRAVIVMFHMGDGPINTLAQNLGTNLEKAMLDYDYVVLLKEENDVAGIQLSAGATSRANLVLDPTADNFVRAFRDVTSKGYDATVFHWGHGTPMDLDDDGVDDDFGFTALDPSDGGDEWLSTAWLRSVLSPSVTGAHTVPIRSVYSVACYHAGFTNAWLEVGAQVVSGAVRINFGPNFYGSFVDDWNSGATHGLALGNEDSASARAATELFIGLQGQTAMADPTLGARPLDCVPPFSLTHPVTGLNACAEWYFENGANSAAGAYDFDGTYDPAMSGADNMWDGSTKVLGGSPTVTKYDAITY